MGQTEKLGQPDISSAWVIIAGIRTKGQWDINQAGTAIDGRQFQNQSVCLVESKGKLLSRGAWDSAPP